MNKCLPHILIVEDDKELASWMQDYLVTKNYKVSAIDRGDEAVSFIKREVPDLVILDGMLPGIDGIDVCKMVRPEFSNIIIMVTARDEEIDEVVGLEVGADDYMTKPVRARVLLSRIRKHLERQAQLVENPPKLGNEKLLIFNNLTIDRSAMSVSLNGSDIKISSHEFEVLWLLAKNAGNVVTREQLVSQLRGFDYDGFDRSMDLKISRIRKKIRNESSDTDRIKTIWGKGYLFAKDD